MKNKDRNPSYVLVNGERVLTDDVKFMDIEEGIFGEDIMTFEYKGKVYKSTVYIR